MEEGYGEVPVITSASIWPVCPAAENPLACPISAAGPEEPPGSFAAPQPSPGAGHGPGIAAAVLAARPTAARPSAEILH